MNNSSGLPITINADQTLIESLGLSTNLLEKLEAWANFATLKANWYGDESNPISIKVTIVSLDFFKKNFSDKVDDKWHVDHTNHTARSSSNNRRNHQVFLSLSDYSSANNSKAAWVESNVQGQLQLQLHSFFQQLATALGLDPIDN